MKNLLYLCIAIKNNNIMNINELIKFLKENLSIEISREEKWNDYYDTFDVIKVELKLGDEVISTTEDWHRESINDF